MNSGNIILLITMTVSCLGVDLTRGSSGSLNGVLPEGASNSIQQERTPDERNTIDVFKRAAKAVVHVRASRLELNSPHEQISTGSGFFVDQQGHVLTNYHVIDGSTRVELLTDGRPALNATLVGTAPAFDVALLKSDLTDGFEPLSLGDSSRLEVGQKVLAIGNPLGLHKALTTGIVSGLARNIPGAPEGLGSALIQTDAAINPGNSGGPLLDSSGKVVGINTAVIRDGQNIGFAVPADLIAKILPDLIAMGHAFRPSLGFTAVIMTSDLAAFFGIPEQSGLLVQEVLYGSPAWAAGLLAGKRMIPIDNQVYVLGGDILVEVNGQRIRSQQDLTMRLLVSKPGDELIVTVFREGQRQQKKIIVPAMHPREP